VFENAIQRVQREEREQDSGLSQIQTSRGSLSMREGKGFLTMALKVSLAKKGTTEKLPPTGEG